MHVRILVQRLRILRVSGKRIESIEATVGRVIEPRSEVLLLRGGVEEFAAVSEVGKYGRAGLDRTTGIVYGERLTSCGEGSAWCGLIAHSHFSPRFTGESENANQRNCLRPKLNPIDRSLPNCQRSIASRKPDYNKSSGWRAPCRIRNTRIPASIGRK